MKAKLRLLCVRGFVELELSRTFYYFLSFFLFNFMFIKFIFTIFLFQQEIFFFNPKNKMENYNNIGRQKSLSKMFVREMY